MWSEKKYIDIIMNVLLFLLGINIFHYGQLLLPIMCLILFVDKGLKFKVKDIKTFTILCLFAISFCAFSYKLGFYCVMGFCLPMAYYIGSNMNEYSENNVKKIVYLISLGMAMHLVLNCICDYIVLGPNFMYRNKHYDVWVRDFIAPNTTAVNLSLIIGCIYYLFLYEKNKKIKLIGTIIFILVMIYDLGLGKRMPMYIFVICIGCSVLYDVLFVSKNKKILLLIVIPIVLLIIIVIMSLFNIFGMHDFLGNFRFVIKIRNHLFDFDRQKIIINASKYFLSNMWGGQKISKLAGAQMHELWLDVFDYAGIVPYILMVMYSIVFFIDCIHLIKSNTTSKEYNLFVLGFLIVVTLTMFVEPVMTGSSIFIISAIMIGTAYTFLK